jgi:hypothetical protein
MTDARRLYPFRGNLEDAMREILEGKPAMAPQGSVVNAGEFLEMHNIICHDHEGKVVEQYDVLLVKKDIERKEDNSPLKMTPYQAISYFEQQGNGLFLPSLRLTNAIVANLYLQKDVNPEAKKVLDQYKDRGDKYGWHTTNTVVDWTGGNIINYPEDTDFPNNGGSNNINSRKRSQMTMNDAFSSEPLETALQNPEHKAVMQDLTGLQNPEILLKIAEYFGRTGRVWTPHPNKYTSGAWVGCDSDNFNIDVGNNLDGNAAVRGVRRQ